MLLLSILCFAATVFAQFITFEALDNENRLMMATTFKSNETQFRSDFQEAYQGHLPNSNADVITFNIVAIERWYQEYLSTNGESGVSIDDYLNDIFIPLTGVLTYQRVSLNAPVPTTNDVVPLVRKRSTLWCQTEVTANYYYRLAASWVKSTSAVTWLHTAYNYAVSVTSFTSSRLKSGSRTLCGSYLDKFIDSSNNVWMIYISPSNPKSCSTIVTAAKMQSLFDSSMGTISGKQATVGCWTLSNKGDWSGTIRYMRRDAHSAGRIELASIICPAAYN